MKLTDIPPHVTELDTVPWFSHSYYNRHNTKYPDNLCDIKPLYHLGYYDGPRSGIFKVDDNYFYGQAIYDEERKWWAAWELTGEDLEKELERHKLIQEYVGGHTDYYEDADENWTRDPSLVKPRESCEIYYKMENKPSVDFKKLTEGEIFGILRNPFWNW